MANEKDTIKGNDQIDK